jgi:transposase
MSKHPQWATNLRKKGTELRLLKGTYYLYEVSSKWNPVLKRSQKISGKLLGKITEKDGFVESDKAKLRNQKLNLTGICTKEYGITAFLESNLNEYKQLLEKHFPNHWQSIIVLSFMRLVKHSPLKNIDFNYWNSYISEIYPELQLSSKALTSLLKEIGSRRQQITDFFKEFKIADDNIIFDGTDLLSSSSKLGINKLSKTKKGTFDLVSNIMFVFSIGLQLPVYYRILPGNIKDIRAFKLCLEESGISEAVVIADKGFYSKSNIEELKQGNIRFIIPLRRNNSNILYEKLENYGVSENCSYFTFEKRIIWYTQYECGNEKINIYLDEELKVIETKDYLTRIEKHPEEFSKEEYLKKYCEFGTIALLNNIDKSAEDIFIDYKSRNQIEIMIDTFKNILEADKSYMQNEESLEGWMFFNHIALHWYYMILKILKDNKLNHKYSPMDFLMYLEEIRKVKINNTWHIAEITKKTQEVLKALKIHIT